MSQVQFPIDLPYFSRLLRTKATERVKMSNCLNSERVRWCESAWLEIRAELLPDAPEAAAVTVGFPTRGAASRVKKTLGQCWGGWQNGEGYFVSLHPCLFPKPLRVLETLIHEQIHATVGLECGHRGAFVRRAREVGLEGKPTSTHAGPELLDRLNVISNQLGPLPPGNGDVNEGHKQSTRLRKYVCECGQIIRAATDSLEAIHEPCGKRFEQDSPVGRVGSKGSLVLRH